MIFRENFINIRPLFVWAFSLILGITLTFLTVYYGKVVFIIPLLLLIVISFVYFLINKPSKSAYVFIAVCFFLFFAGSALISIRISNLEKTKKYDGEKVSVYGTVKSLTFSDIYNILELENVIFNDNESVNTYISALIYDTSLNFSVGDDISFKATVKYKPLKSGGAYSLGNNSLIIAESVKEVSILANNPNFFQSIYLRIKQIVYNNCGSQAPFCMALLAGDTNGIEFVKLQNYRYLGVAHIFAVSGLHIGFLSLVLNKFFELIKIKRIKKTVLITIITLFYAGICGFSVSALRAVIMCAVYYTVASFGQKQDLINSISISLIVVLLIFPHQLFSAGFQLSYAAVFGIAIFFKTFENIFKNLPPKLNSALSVSISAELGVLPLLLYYFGYTSVATLIANLIIVPLVTIVFYAIFIITFIVLLLPQLGKLFILINWLVSLIDGYMGLVDFRRLNIMGIVTIIPLCIYYLLIIISSDKVNCPKKVKTACLVLAIETLFLCCV